MNLAVMQGRIHAPPPETHDTHHHICIPVISPTRMNLPRCPAKYERRWRSNVSAQHRCYPEFLRGSQTKAENVRLIGLFLPPPNKPILLYPSVARVRRG